MKKSICFVLPSIAKGGAERVITVLSNEMVLKGHNVYILIFNDNQRAYELNPKIEVIEYKTSYQRRIKNVLERLVFIRRFLKTHKDTVIFAFLLTSIIYSTIASLFLTNKIVVCERNDPNNEPKSWKGKFKRNICFRLAETCVFQTKDAKAYFPKSVQKKSKIIFNPIKQDLPLRVQSTDSRIIINACRLNPQKNLKILIDAFEMLIYDFPDYCLHIYGEGELREELINYILEKGLQKSIVIKEFSSDIFSEYMNACMFVSSSDYEGISNSMLEALAIGLPVVCTDCPAGGARMFVVPYENGILTPVRDARALYEGMKYLLEHPDISLGTAEKAVQLRHELSTERICSQWLDLA